MKVVLSVIGGSAGGQELDLDVGTMLNDVLEEHVKNRDGAEVRLNNRPVEGNPELRDGDVVIVVPRIVGGMLA